MGIFRQFPYSNFHDMNMDEIIKIVKQLAEEWSAYQAQWSDLYEDTAQAIEEFREYVRNYFDNLNLQNEVNVKINQMIADGTIDTIVRTELSPVVTTWLDANITTPETVVIDKSLSIADACADAKATGDAIKVIDHNNNQFINGSGSFKFKWEQGSLALSTGAEEDAAFAIRTKLVRFNNPAVIHGYSNSDGTRTDLLKFNRDGTYSGLYVANFANYTVTENDIANYDFRLRIINTNLRPVVPDLGYTNISYTFAEFLNIPDMSAIVNSLDIDNNGEKSGKYQFKWELGNIALSTGASEDATFCARTLFTKFTQPVTITPYLADGYSNYICKYDLNGTFISYEFFDKDYYISDIEALYKLKLLKTNLTPIAISLTRNIYYKAIQISKLYGKTIVCLGDSITGNFRFPLNYEAKIAEMTGAIVKDGGFGGCAMSDNGQERSPFSMCRLADAIAGGDWSAQLNSGVEIDYAYVHPDGDHYNSTGINYVPDKINMLRSTRWANVDYLLIAYGTNDWASDYLLENPNNKYDRSTYIGAFRYSVERILNAYPNLKIVPITPLWRWWDQNTGAGTYGDSDTVPNRISQLYLYQFAQRLKEVAENEYHLPVIDMYYKSGMNKFNRYAYFFTDDGTHPKPDGLFSMGETIASALLSN